jgi:hypothetical protein
MTTAKVCEVPLFSSLRQSLSTACLRTPTEASPLAQAGRQRQATRHGLEVHSTFSRAVSCSKVFAAVAMA